MSTPTTRLHEIAAIYAAHDQQLRRLVARHANANDATIDDACSYAWMKLVTSEHVSLGPPRCSALAWLTTTAIHRAWKLTKHDARTHPVAGLDELGQLAAAHGHTAPSAEHVAAQHLRLDLVAQIPERPRRFLLRLAVGYSYTEIAAAEGVSARTTDRQIARAKRILRDLQNT